MQTPTALDKVHMTSTITPKHQQRRRILKNTAANAVAQAATMLSTLILLPLLVGHFTVPLYGTFALSTSVTSYAVLLDFGISATLTRLVAERSARQDSPGAARAVVTAAALYGALGFAVAIVMVVLGYFAGSIFDVSAGEALLLQRCLWVGAAASAVQWPAMAARDTLAGLQRYDLISRMTLGIVLADIASTIFVISSGRGLVTFAALRAAAQIAAALVGVVLAIRLLPSLTRRARPSATDARHILHSGSSVFALQVAGTMSRQQADKLIIGVFVGTAAVALYDIAAKLNTLASVLTGVTVSAVLPVAAEINAVGDQTHLRDLFLRGTKLISTLIAPITTVLIVLAVPFITAWFGPGFEEAGRIAQLLLASQLLLPLYQLGDQILIGKNRFSVWVRGGMTLAAFNVALSLVLVQFWGPIGVAAATLIACLLEFPWYARVFGREMALDLGPWLRKTAWPVYPLLLVPAGVALLAVSSGFGSTPIQVAIIAGASLLAYWAAALPLAYSADERTYLRDLLRRAQRGAVAS